MSRIGMGPSAPAYNPDHDPSVPPCEVCLQDTMVCECPECDVCGEAGNPDCYAQGRFVNHGLMVTQEMRDQFAERDRLIELAHEMEEAFWRRMAEDYDLAEMSADVTGTDATS